MLARIFYDVDAVQYLLLDKFIYFFQSVLVGLSILIIILYLNWKMVAAALIFLPVFYALYLLFKNKIFKLSKEAQEKQEELTERIQEDLQMVKVIQSFSAVETRMKHAYKSIQETEDAKSPNKVLYINNAYVHLFNGYED